MAAFLMMLQTSWKVTSTFILFLYHLYIYSLDLQENDGGANT